jgi:hypothetical protein
MLWRKRGSLGGLGKKFQMLDRVLKSPDAWIGIRKVVVGLWRNRGPGGGVKEEASKRQAGLGRVHGIIGGTSAGFLAECETARDPSRHRDFY